MYHAKNKAYISQHSKKQDTKFSRSTFICIALHRSQSSAVHPTVICLSILKMELHRSNLKPIHFISLYFAHSAGLKVKARTFFTSALKPRAHIEQGKKARAEW